ncbi:MAG: restriction endonuclease [Hyphomonadaceae bacterium]
MRTTEDVETSLGVRNDAATANAGVTTASAQEDHDGRQAKDRLHPGAVDAIAPLAPSAVRYIKLGERGKWVESAFANHRLELGHASVPPRIIARRDWEAIQRLYIEEGKSSGVARRFRREVEDFASCPATTLWVTFAHGRMWWAFAGDEVTYLGGDGARNGIHARRLLAPWRSTDIQGAPLALEDLSTAITKTMATENSIATPSAAERIVRRINAQPEPAIAAVLTARSALVTSVSELLPTLHQDDFELLVDLIFSRSGWRRIGVLGGGTADSDLILQQPTTNERAFVQVKSRSNARELEDYIRRFEARSDCSRMFFVCHSPHGAMPHLAKANISLWLGDDLAAQVIDAGLVDWLLAHAR